MSYAVGGRSGNRGQCAQPCRRRYTLVNRDGTKLAEGHLLSLHDLCLSEHLDELIEAGVSSFKIEGRLKDVAYVKNVVSHYRQALDQVLRDVGLARSSSGQSQSDFTPDLAKTFNRGYTTYYVQGRGTPPGRPATPKMVGEPAGRVLAIEGRSLRLGTDLELHTGDGLCFFDRAGNLRGTFVNGVRGPSITVEDSAGLREGTLVYRNHDHQFLSRLEKARVERRIAVWFTLGESATGFSLAAVDEDGNRATGTLEGERTLARKREAMLATLQRQLHKTGGTEFACQGVEVAWPEVYFLPISAVNELRRRTLARLAEARARDRPIWRRGPRRDDAPYPENRLTYAGNVLNQRAADFYRRHGVREIEPAAESGLNMEGRQVMRTRYCLLEQIGLCRKTSPDAPQGPLYLVDEGGHRYRLAFDCAVCEMAVFF
jgi:putative protease